MGTFYVYNNTWRNPQVYQVSQITTTTFTFKNNIWINGGGAYHSYYGGDSCAGCSGSNNIYYGGSQTIAWDTSTLKNNNPMFTNASPSVYTDYALQASSPGIGAGTASGLLAAVQYAGWNDPGTDYDFEYKARGTNHDIGALEYAESTVPLGNISNVSILPGVTIR